MNTVSNDEEMFEESEEIVDQELLLKDKIRKAKASAIGRKSKHKGARYENVLRKKIASYFGFKPEQVFISVKSHPQFGQTGGDLVPINDLARLWYAKGLGVIEAKNQEAWNFNTLFTTDLKNHVIYKYWLKSNSDTFSTNSLIFFTKNHVTDYVFHLNNDNIEIGNPHIKLYIEKKEFIIQSLSSFLVSNFPQ